MAEGWFCELTPPGKGGLAVLSLGGPAAAPFLEERFRPFSGFPVPGAAAPGRLHGSGGLLDECVLAVPAAGLYELHLHGSPAVTAAVKAELRRAGFEEISAPPTEDERVRLLPLAVSARSAEMVARSGPETWREKAAEWLESLREGEEERVAREAEIRAAAHRLVRALERPPRVLIAGAPNAGKSTLFNALLGRKRSLVSDREATTHDLVEERTVLRGFPVVLLDSPGRGGRGEWAPFLDGKAEEGRRSAELVIEVVDLAAPAERRLEAHLTVGNKADLAARAVAASGCDVVCSALTGEGVAEVAEKAADLLGFPPADEPLPVPAALTKETAAALDRIAEAIRLRKGDPSRMIVELMEEGKSV